MPTTTSVSVSGCDESGSRSGFGDVRMGGFGDVDVGGDGRRSRDGRRSGDGIGRREEEREGEDFEVGDENGDGNGDGNGNNNGNGNDDEIVVLENVEEAEGIREDEVITSNDITSDDITSNDSTSNATTDQSATPSPLGDSARAAALLPLPLSQTTTTINASETLSIPEMTLRPQEEVTVVYDREEGARQSVDQEESAGQSTSPMLPSQTISIQDLTGDLGEEIPADPPPPYPSSSSRRTRRSRSRRSVSMSSRGQRVGVGRRDEGDVEGLSEYEHEHEYECDVDGEGEGETRDGRLVNYSYDGSPRVGYNYAHGSYTDDHPPLHSHSHSHHLSNLTAQSRQLHGQNQHQQQHQHQRPHSISHASTISAAPSFAQTVLSLFNTEDDVYLDDESGDEGGEEGGAGTGEDRRLNLLGAGSALGGGGGGSGGQGGEDHEGVGTDHTDTESVSLIGGRLGVGRTRKGIRKRFGDKKWWKRYFRPMKKASYYRPLLHLAVINFPFALAAWVYLVVFTVVGTTLLVALPLGAFLCFVNLLGARLFSRGELALQARFHPSLALIAPYPPRPIFTRWREATVEEVEGGQGMGVGTARMGLGLGMQRRNGMVKEKSFYKNSYAMFTDPTSYQALFYFIVIKPGITLVILLFIIVLGIPSFVLIVPAPAVLRAVRRIGVWQAGVAIEGLYLAVR